MRHLRSVHDGGCSAVAGRVLVGSDQQGREAVTTPEGFPRIAEKLTWIINTIPTADGRRLTPERISRKILDQTGGDFEVSGSHIQALKTGLRDKPSARLLVEIARAVGLPSAFFWSDVADRLLREVVENAIRDRDASAASSYDALLLKADPDLSSERLDRMRSLLLAIMGDSAANSDDTP